MMIVCMMIMIMMTYVFPNNGWRVRRLPAMSIQHRFDFEPNGVWFVWVIYRDCDLVYQRPAPSRIAPDSMNSNLMAIGDRTTPYDDTGHSMLIMDIWEISDHTPRMNILYNMWWVWTDERCCLSYRLHIDSLSVYFCVLIRFDLPNPFSTTSCFQNGWEGGGSLPFCIHSTYFHLFRRLGDE